MSHMSLTSQPELFERVVGISEAAISRVDPSMFDKPTPCTDWNVRQLMNHMAVTCRFAGAIMDGNAPSEDRLAGHDVLGNDFKASYAKVAAGVVYSFGAIGAMDREVQAPPGKVPGSFWVSFPTWDLYLHTWDLTTATGTAMEQPDEVTESVLAWGQQMFSGPRDVGQIGELVETSPGAPVMDRLVALFGRRP